MVGESTQNVLLIQIEASSFAEFKISEFELSRFDCILFLENYPAFKGLTWHVTCSSSLADSGGWGREDQESDPGDRAQPPPQQTTAPA